MMFHHVQSTFSPASFSQASTPQIALDRRIRTIHFGSSMNTVGSHPGGEIPVEHGPVTSFMDQLGRELNKLTQKSVSDHKAAQQKPDNRDVPETPVRQRLNIVG